MWVARGGQVSLPVTHGLGGRALSSVSRSPRTAAAGGDLQPCPPSWKAPGPPRGQRRREVTPGTAVCRHFLTSIHSVPQVLASPFLTGEESEA